MEINFQENTSGITDVPGFEAAGVHCDVRETGDPRLDVALIYSSTPCTAAGVFTLNDVKAAPVKLCQKALKDAAHFHAILTNSGNANACTGEQGKQNAHAMAQATAKACQIAPESVFVCSTGRIGRQLPMDKLLHGISLAAKEKSTEPTHGTNASNAILTSDTRAKTATASFTWNNQKVTLAGMAKGAGMIEPNMATMLAYVVTDAKIVSNDLQSFLNNANNQSFNSITVDGDMSTNDTVLCLANGQSQVSITADSSELAQTFQEALNKLCFNLAKKIVGDGEKVTKLVTLKILGAPDAPKAEKIARTIGNSLLVKTSWFGSDPNWGRVMDAAGYARIGLVEEKVDLHYNDCSVLEQGTPIDDNLQTWKDIASQDAFTITLDLNLGDASYQLLSADLSEEYVNFNKSE